MTAFRLGWVGIACLLVVSCATDEDRRWRSSQAHALHSRQLQATMGSLERHVRGWSGEIARLQAGPTAEQYEQAAEAANRLANAAHAIGEAVPENVLSGPERQAFLRLVAQLESQARGLANSATARDGAGMEASFTRLRTTCNECHARFRDVAGTL